MPASGSRANPVNELVQQVRKAAGQGGTVSIRPVDGLPLVAQRDDIAALIGDALSARGDALVAGDIVVIAQKIVSKAEGRCVDLATVTPSPRACELAAETGKDPRLVELILSESEAVLRTREGLIVVVHRNGYVLANAGIDQSNIAGGADDEAGRLAGAVTGGIARAGSGRLTGRLRAGSGSGG